jgi:hypothetical protein
MRLNSFFLVLASAAAAVSARGQTGPSVGTKVPDFQAVDQTGAPHTLSTILGPQGALLVFYRSADW